jgi:NAD dependent epimerase/dehydratase
MTLKGKRVLVTGGGGFIASHLVERLVDIGAHVRALVRYNSHHDRGMLEKISPKSIKSIDIFQGDLRELESIREALSGIQLVFHLGAMISIPYSLKNPVDVVNHNVLGTANLLRICVDHDIDRLVHISSCEVYGTAQYIPIDEKHPLVAHSPYAASKIAAEKLVESFMFSYDLPAVIIRPFNTYGPRQSCRAIIPSVIVQALSRSSIKLGNLLPYRDFNYISDTVEGLILSAEVDRAGGEVINLGNNKSISIEELVKKILKMLNRENVKIMRSPERLRPEKCEVYRLIADNNKARNLLGWSSSVDLDSGLEKTIKWIQDNIEDLKSQMFYS